MATQLAQCLGLGVEPGKPALAVARRINRRRFRLLTQAQCLRGLGRRGACILDGAGRLGDGGGGSCQSLGRHHRGDKRLALPLGFGQPRLQSAAPFGELAALPLQGGTARLAAGARLGHLLQPGLGGAQIGAGRIGARCRVGMGHGRVPFGSFQRRALVGKAGEGGVGIGEVLGLAVEVGGELDASPLGLFLCRDDAAELLFERRAGMRDPRRRRRGGGLRQAQRRQRRLRLGALVLMRYGIGGGGGDLPLARPQLARDALGRRRCGLPACL